MQQRHVLYLLICVGVIVAYGQRFGFNVALTSMTHPLVPTQGSEAANKSLVGSENGGSKCVSIYSEEADVSFPRVTCLFYEKMIKLKTK